MTELTETFRDGRRFLSNFSADPVTYDGVQYATGEHAFQAAKTLDTAQRKAIGAAPSPGDARRAGRKCTLRPGWDDLRDQVMATILASKFAAGSDLAGHLDGTGDDELVEVTTWGDRYWGVDTHGRGKNHLGRLLMARRAINRAVAAGSPVLDVHADLWDLHLSGAVAVVPTTTERRGDGTAAMDAGIARTAAMRFDDLERRYGDALASDTSPLYLLHERLVLLPTEHERGDAELVRSSIADLAGLARRHEVIVAVPALGARSGRLDWDTVFELLRTELDGIPAVLLPPP